jgi:plastocyanin
MRQFLRGSIALLGLSLIGLAGPASAADAVKTIEIVKNADGKFVFSVPKAKIEPGETIKWAAKDADVPHQLVPDTDEDAFKDTGQFDSSNPPKQKFSTSGLIKYHCAIHPNSMKGSIRVTAAEPPPEPPAADTEDAPGENAPAKEEAAPKEAPAKKAPAKKAPPSSYDPY